MKSFGVGALLMGLLSFASVANAQTANSQSDGRDYEALAYLPKDTLAAIVYFREQSKRCSAMTHRYRRLDAS